VKRWIFTILLFLLLGAIVNIAVAWGLAISVDVDSEPTGFEERAEWPDVVPENWPGPLIGVWRGGFGWRASTHIAMRLAMAADREGWNAANHYLHSAEVGWPYPSLYWRVRAIVSPQGMPAQSWSPVITGNGIRPDWDGLGFTPLSWKRLPTRPIWPGFLINTIFYALVLLPLYCTPFIARRHIRVKRGRCPQCGYDLRGELDAGCPECGWNRQPEATA